MRDNFAPDLPNERQLAAALAEQLDQAAPRRNLWPSIQRQIHFRKVTSQKSWWRRVSPFGVGFPRWALAVSVLALCRRDIPTLEADAHQPVVLSAEG